MNQSPILRQPRGTLGYTTRTRPLPPKKRIFNFSDDRICGCDYWAEHWVRIPGAEDYEVSSCGRVRRRTDAPGARSGHILKPQGNQDGYSVVFLSSIQKIRRIHKLVSTLFLGPRPLDKEVNHKDGKKPNNCVTNLEYLTPKENQEHATRMMLKAKGERNHFAKLTEEQVLNIRKLGESMNAKQVSIAVGMPHTTVWQIIARKNWKHI